MRAPSAGNIQAYYIIAVSNEEMKKALAKAAFKQTWM